MSNYILLLNWTEQGVKSVGESATRYDKAKEMAFVLEALASAERDTPDYIETDGKSAKLTRIPSLSDVPYPVQMQPALVVEFYSR